jgi:hypothetical protein
VVLDKVGVQGVSDAPRGGHGKLCQGVIGKGVVLTVPLDRRVAAVVVPDLGVVERAEGRQNAQLQDIQVNLGNLLLFQQEIRKRRK